MVFLLITHGAGSPILSHAVFSQWPESVSGSFKTTPRSNHRLTFSPAGSIHNHYVHSADIPIECILLKAGEESSFETRRIEETTRESMVREGGFAVYGIQQRRNGDSGGTFMFLGGVVVCPLRL